MKYSVSTMISASRWFLSYAREWLSDRIPHCIDPKDVAICVIHGVNAKAPEYLKQMPWPRLQLEQLRRFTAPGYTVYVYCNNLIPEHESILHEYPEVKVFSRKEGYTTAAPMNQVWPIRNWLAHKVAPHHRYIVHLDSDAFPVRDDWLPRYARKLCWHTPVVAVQRLENGDNHSDRSFLMYRRTDLRRHLFDFASIGVKDAGGNISADLERKGLKWYPLTRSNAFDYHPLIAGIYDDRIYHHAAGSRNPEFRLNHMHWNDDDFMAQEKSTHEKLMRRLFDDPDRFIEELRGKYPPASLSPQNRRSNKVENTKQQFLFVCGPGRSGTSASADLLRSHEAIAMGRERFAWRLTEEENAFIPQLFEKERFCRHLDPSDSHHLRLTDYYDLLYERFDRCRYVGDKIPRIYLKYDYIRHTFPDCKIIYIARDLTSIASSFEMRAREAAASLEKNPNLDPRRLWPVDRGWKMALPVWNEALEKTLPLLPDPNFFVLSYEQLFKDDTLLPRLFDFLGLPVTDDVIAHWNAQKTTRAAIEKRRINVLGESQLNYLNNHARNDLFQKLLTFT